MLNRPYSLQLVYIGNYERQYEYDDDDDDDDDDGDDDDDNDDDDYEDVMRIS